VSEGVAGERIYQMQGFDMEQGCVPKA